VLTNPTLDQGYITIGPKCIARTSPAQITLTPLGTSNAT